MKTYDQAPPHVYDTVSKLLMRHHQRLAAAGVKVDLVYCSTDTDGEDAVKLHGWPCFAVVRIVGLKDRSMGRGDAEIVIDRDKYEGMDEAKRNALMDHELYHLELDKGADGMPKIDSAGRPKLKIRLHDREFGWFDEIARRHGAASIEVQQAKHLRDEAGQLYFNFPALQVAKAV